MKEPTQFQNQFVFPIKGRKSDWYKKKKKVYFKNLSDRHKLSNLSTILHVANVLQLCKTWRPVDSCSLLAKHMELALFSMEGHAPRLLLVKAKV